MQLSTAIKENNQYNGRIQEQKALYSDRIARMREALLASPYEGCIERARYYTRAYKGTEGQAPCLRAAKGLEETLRHMTIWIDEEATLVGNKASKKIAGPMGIERTYMDRVNLLAVPFHGQDKKSLSWLENGHGANPEWLKELLTMPEEEIREVKEEIDPYWVGRNMASQMHARWMKEGLVTKEQPLPTVAGVADMQGHVTVGMKKALDLGFKGIAAQAVKQLALLNEGDEKYALRKDFLESVPVAAGAVCAFAERYARLAEDLAQQAAEPRKSELLAIAERCRRVPAEPPRTFMEAVQSAWMTQVVMTISYGEDSIFCPGRMDQFLYPYFQSDLEAGRITPDQALEIIEEYFIKLCHYNGFGPNNVTIGGVDRKGNSAVNDISYLMLEALMRLKAIRNGLAVRIAKNTPREFLLKACEAHRRTAGIQFDNDEVNIPGMMADGYALEDARDYSIIGCAEIAGTGNSNGYCSGSSCHLERTIESALNEGRLFAAKWAQVGVKTPPPSEMKSFEEVKAAFAAQLANAIEVMVKISDVKDDVFAEGFPTPLISSTIEGCIESGLDITQGGAKYNHSTVSAHALATVVNSLAAIRWAVFEEKIVTLEALVGHLRNNFKDAEELRQQLLRKAPKYGVNDPKVDEIAVWVTDLLDKESRKHKRPIDGGTYRGLLISAGGQVLAGHSLGATPDGRKAREAVANGLSPANGTDIEGMTAAFHSVAKASRAKLSGGTALNMNLNPMTIKTDENLEKFASLIEGYFELGGRQVQINPMGRETLLDAQKNPGDYPDLMVKVSGYSYRFVDLSKGLQDDIISRTEFEV
ncbi:MAG: pyruvate formate lyase family protein [Thermodesulfobacteriota bacterium]